MKKLVLTLIAFVSFYAAKAQTRTPGPAETKLSNQLCDCITKLDKSKLRNAQEAKQAFMDCFTEQADLLADVAAERGVQMSDDEAMNKIGTEIGENLLKMKCSGFMTLAVKMASKESSESPENKTTTGVFKRIDNKGFNYIIVTSEGKEKSFLWFGQFTGSDAFTGPVSKLVGKKIQVSWRDVEAYLPAAKGYYNVKEITSIEILK